MSNNFKIVREDKNPVFCVITPLKSGDKISRDTKISVKRNKYPFIWATYESDNNVARNFKLGLQELEKHRKLPPFTCKIDNDTIWNRNTLDSMVNTLKDSSKNVAYCYCSFEYKGSVNQKFTAIDFDANRLRMGNYISSNSMFKTAVLKDFPLIDSDYYKRLLDYAYFLFLLNNGYIGIPDKKGYFIAISKGDSISAGGQKDFQIKYKRVQEDFVKGK